TQACKQAVRLWAGKSWKGWVATGLLPAGFSSCSSEAQKTGCHGGHGILQVKVNFKHLAVGVWASCTTRTSLDLHTYARLRSMHTASSLPDWEAQIYRSARSESRELERSVGEGGIA